MKKRKGFRLICYLVIIMMLFAACGKKKEIAYDSAPPESAGTSDVNDGVNMADNKGAVDGEVDPSTTSDNGSKDDVKTTSLGSTSEQDKIIYKYVLDIETQDFDKLLSDTEGNIKSMGGYTESSQIGGKSYNNDNVNRSGYIVARIPSNKASDFISFIKKAANVTKSEQSSENVSLQYVDAKSKVDTLKIEQERLYDILKSAKELDNIITLETRLSDIRYEIEKYQSQLRLYDNQVEFSNVTLNIMEVKHISPAEEVKPTFFSRISDGLSRTIDNVSNGFQSFIVWLVVNFLYFLIWGVIILAILLVTRLVIRKNSKKNLTSCFGTMLADLPLCIWPNG